MRCVIIGGAAINNVSAIKKYLKTDDYIICCDSGLYNAQKLEITPHLIIGDFDSHPKPDSDIETITLPCEKDDTDTVYAAKEALSKAFGTGISEKIHFQNIEITNTSQGCPVLKLCEAAESLRLERGISKIHLSISHADHYATAIVVLESDSHPPT